MVQKRLPITTSTNEVGSPVTIFRKSNTFEKPGPCRVSKLKSCLKGFFHIAVQIRAPYIVYVPRIHIPAHLIENKPVSNAAVFSVVFHVPHVGIRLEVPAHFHAHHMVAEMSGTQLDYSVEEPKDGEQRQEQIPEPKNEKYLRKREKNVRCWEWFMARETGEGSKTA